MQVFTELFSKYIDVTLAILIIVTAFWFKKYMLNILPKVPMAHKVLLWSTAISIGYYFLLKFTGSLKKDDIVVYVITYCFTTSFYELVFSPLQTMVQNLIQKVLPAQPDQKQQS